MKKASEADLVTIQTEIENRLLESVDWFERNYDTVSHHFFGPGSERVYLGDKSNRLCRYCGLSAPNVKFRNIAHAFPDQIGNDWLFDHAECDKCNSHFSKYVEDDFAKWTLPWRSLGRISGKNGVPSIKSNDKQFRIDAVANELPADKLSESRIRHDLEIKLALNDARQVIDKSRKTITYTLERQPYFPMGVYKCLVKMAIAIMPPDEEIRWSHLKDWILLENHTRESTPYKPLNILYQIFPGPLPNDRFNFWLLRRKKNAPDNCFYMQFILQMAGHVFQIALPMQSEVREGASFGIEPWPHPYAHIHHQMKYGISQREELDMSGTDQNRGEKKSLTFHYDELIEAPDIAMRMNSKLSQAN